MSLCPQLRLHPHSCGGQGQWGTRRQEEGEGRPPALRRPHWPAWAVPDYLFLQAGSSTGFLPGVPRPWPPPEDGGPGPAWMWGYPCFCCKGRFLHWVSREGQEGCWVQPQMYPERGTRKGQGQESNILSESRAWGCNH